MCWCSDWTRVELSYCLVFAQLYFLSTVHCSLSNVVSTTKSQRYQNRRTYYKVKDNWNVSRFQTKSCICQQGRNQKFTSGVFSPVPFLFLYLLSIPAPPSGLSNPAKGFGGVLLVYQRGWTNLTATRHISRAPIHQKCDCICRPISVKRNLIIEANVFVSERNRYV